LSRPQGVQFFSFVNCPSSWSVLSRRTGLSLLFSFSLLSFSFLFCCFPFPCDCPFSFVSFLFLPILAFSLHWWIFRYNLFLSFRNILCFSIVLTLFFPHLNTPCVQLHVSMISPMTSMYSIWKASTERVF
jgi:hypothetical protein